MVTTERPALGVGDYVRGYCSAHDHQAEGRVLDDDGRNRFRVRFEDALGRAETHLMARNECILVERAVTTQRTCDNCGKPATHNITHAWGHRPLNQFLVCEQCRTKALDSDARFVMESVQ